MVAQLEDAKKIKEMITACVKSADDLYTSVHAAAVQCLLHAEAHGDVTLLDDLIRGLNKGTYSGGLRFWAAKYTPIRWNGDGKIGLIGPKKSPTMFEEHLKANNNVAWNIVEAEANAFWTLEEVQAAKEKQPITDARFLGAVDKMVKSFKKAVDEGKFTGDEARVNAYLTALKAVPVPVSTPANDGQTSNVPDLVIGIAAAGEAVAA